MFHWLFFIYNKNIRMKLFSNTFKLFSTHQDILNYEGENHWNTFIGTVLPIIFPSLHAYNIFLILGLAMWKVYLYIFSNSILCNCQANTNSMASMTWLLLSVSSENVLRMLSESLCHLGCLNKKLKSFWEQTWNVTISSHEGASNICSARMIFLPLLHKSSFYMISSE